MVSTNKHSEEKAKLSKWSSWKTKVQHFTESIDHYLLCFNNSLFASHLSYGS